MTLQLPERHRPLLAGALDLGAANGLALMGGYAVQAHGCEVPEFGTPGDLHL